MKVAILYSGGKDSTLAINYALKNKHQIEYLLSVKPTRTDCYLFHYATVEHTKEIANILNTLHILTSCSIANPEKEAQLIKEIVEKQSKIDALILGGTGLQITQIASIQKALKPLNIEVFASHSGEDHDKVFENLIKNDYEIIITQIASQGLDSWLGKTLTKDNFQELKKDSIKHGFHIGGEGGYFDTLVLDTPFFNKKLIIQISKTIMESEYCGYVKINKLDLIEKQTINFFSNNNQKI